MFSYAVDLTGVVYLPSLGTIAGRLAGRVSRCAARSAGAGCFKFRVATERAGGAVSGRRCRDRPVLFWEVYVVLDHSSTIPRSVQVAMNSLGCVLRRSHSSDTW